MGPEGAWGDWVQEVAFAPRGDTLATLSSGTGWPPDQAQIQLWQAKTGAPGLRLSPDLPPDSHTMLVGLKYVRDHRLHIVRRTEVRQPRRLEHDVLCWDARTGKAVEMPRGVGHALVNLPRPRCEAISPDGRLLAVGTETDSVLYELATGKEVGRLRDLPGSPIHQVFSADGRSLAVLSQVAGAEPIGTVVPWGVGVWDVASGR